MHPSLPGGALASGGGVSPTPNTTDHRWDLATGGDAGDVAATGAAIPLVATNVQTTAAVCNSKVSGGASSVTVHDPSDSVHTFNAVNKDAVHNGAMPPPLMPP